MKSDSPRDDEQRASEVTNHKSEPLDRWRLYPVDAFGCKRKARDVSCGVGVAHEVAELQNNLGELWWYCTVVEARSGIFHAQNPRA